MTEKNNQIKPLFTIVVSRRASQNAKQAEASIYRNTKSDRIRILCCQPGTRTKGFCLQRLSEPLTQTSFRFSLHIRRRLKWQKNYLLGPSYMTEHDQRTRERQARRSEYSPISRQRYSTLKYVTQKQNDIGFSFTTFMLHACENISGQSHSCAVSVSRVE